MQTCDMCDVNHLWNFTFLFLSHPEEGTRKNGASAKESSYDLLWASAPYLKNASSKFILGENAWSKFMLGENACSKFMLGENACSKFMFGENACSKFMLGENACSIQKTFILQSYPPTTENRQKLGENCYCLMFGGQKHGKSKETCKEHGFSSPSWSQHREIL